jgi:hypothetical protein
MEMTLEAACRATLVHLEFRDGPLWTFVDPSNAHIVSPAFGAREEAKAWQAPYLEEREAAARAAEEGAQTE